MLQDIEGRCIPEKRCLAGGDGIHDLAAQGLRGIRLDLMEELRVSGAAGFPHETRQAGFDQVALGVIQADSGDGINVARPDSEFIERNRHQEIPPRT